MPFIADSAPSGFVADKPRATGGFVPDNQSSGFVADDQERAQGLFGTKIGTAERPIPVVSQVLGKLMGVSPGEASNALMVAAREPARLARKGLNFIPDVPEPQHQSVALNLAQNLARGTGKLAKDVVAGMIEPESAVVAGAGELARPLAEAPFVKSGIQAAGDLAAKHLPTLSRFFTYRFGQPEEYVAQAEQRLASKAAGIEKGGELGTAMSKDLSRAQQQRLGQIFKGGVSVSEREAPLREAAMAGRDEFIKRGGQAVDEGLLDEKTYFKNLAEYMPRKYRLIENDNPGLSESFGGKPQRIQGDLFKKRQDLSQDMRSFLGEIKEPAYPVARGIAQLTHDVETAKLFNSVAKNPEWSSAVPAGDFVKLDSTKRLGSLAGRYVHPEIARDINEMVRIPGYAEKVYKDILHAWKFGKVVLNPASNSRNMMANSVLMDVGGGVDLLHQPGLLMRAAKQFQSNGNFFQEAKDANLLGHEFSNAEIKGFIDAFDKPSETMLGKAMNMPKKSAAFLGKAYQGEEKVFKLANFIHARESGLGIKEAAATAEKNLFNYDKISPFIRTMRNSPIGAPFITFTSKALPVIAEAAVKNPMRLYKYKILFDSLENMAREKYDLSDKEINTIKRNQRGSVVILPMKDKDGKLQTLDLSYILPWGDIAEQGGALGLPPSLSPGGLVKPFFEAGLNKSLFKAGYSKFDPVKAQIYLDSDPEPVKWRKRIDYIYKSFAPSFAPPIPGVSAGGYHTEKLIKAQEGKPDYFGRVRSISTVLADIFLGLKVSPVDAQVMNQFERLGMKKELDEIRREVKNKFRDKGASEDDRAEAKRVMADKIQTLIEKKSEMEQ